MTRYAAKVDANHADIRDGLRAIFGIACCRGRVAFLEVKQPGKATRLTESEAAARVEQAAAHLAAQQVTQ